MIRWAIVTAVLCTFTVVRGPAWASGFLSSPCRISRSNGVRSSSTNGMSGRAVSRPTMLKSSADVHINKDIVVIGGGLAGLSTALELAKRGRQVMVLSRSRSEAAAEAAGGMIAPQAERLESGPYLDLCLASRAMYADWVSSIESIAGLGGDKAETHFWSCGGFLAPAFGGDAVHVWKPPLEGGQAHWINREQALNMEPSLSPDIVGAWWYPQDMSIDAQRMFGVLEQACSKAGVEILEGTAASSLVYGREGSTVEAVVLEDGRRLHTNAVVSAAGAWMRELMPVPMLPHKGQMMSLREPESLQGAGAGSPRQGGGIGLTRVFFAEGVYIIPKRDGRIVVGSTVEVGQYGLHNTPAGMKQIIDAAIKVCPALANLAIERTWAGLRPVTPDSFPVLGASSRCRNLFVAGGYWRNGVLLAPKTAQLVADAVCGCLSAQDKAFTEAFTMDRFMVPGGEHATQQSGASPSPQPSSVVNDEPVVYSSEVSRSGMLEMERAALEGTNDGRLSGLEGLFGRQADAKTGASGRALEQPATVVQESEREFLPAEAVSSASSGREPVNDYDASERFSEESLKEARMANRLLEEGSDARLEAMFGDGPEEETIPNIKAWEAGADDVAAMLGAEMVEMEIDVPEGMTIEEALSQQGPIMKVFWGGPDGDVEVPKGMNLASMVEGGLIPPLKEEVDGEETTSGGGAGGREGVQQTAPGVFDPTAVKGPEERSTEVSDLYAKVMANKAKAKQEAERKELGGSRGATPVAKSSELSPNGFEDVEAEGKRKRKNSWLGDIFHIGGSNNEKEKSVHEQDADGVPPGASSGHEKQQGAAIGTDAGTGSEPVGAGDGEPKEMVGYDFIMQDRNDKEGKVAKDARAASRDALEGENAWASYEEIANEAMRSVKDMSSVDYLPPR